MQVLDEIAPVPALAPGLSPEPHEQAMAWLSCGLAGMTRRIIFRSRLGCGKIRARDAASRRFGQPSRRNGRLDGDGREPAAALLAQHS